MRTTTLVMLLLLLFCNCGDDKKSENDLEQKVNPSALLDHSSSETNIANQIVFHPLSDGKSAEPYGMMPLPANWRLNSAGTFIESPDGVKIYNFPLHFFVYSEDAYFAQLYQQSGQAFRIPQKIENILDQELAPIAQRENAKLISYNKIQEIADADRNYDALLFKVAATQQWFDALISEWEDAQGNPFLIIVHQNVSSGNNLVNWSYFCQAMQAPKAKYQSAKKTFIYGLVNTIYNPRNVEAYNREEARKANVSMAAHQQRMNEMQQQFDASQRAFESKRDAINTAITQSYNSADAASDRQHNRFLNYIKGEETVSANGKRYQVESGAEHYWVNENKQYTGSNDPNYDPNRNQGSVNHQWTDAEIEN